MVKLPDNGDSIFTPPERLVDKCSIAMWLSQLEL